MLEKIDLDADEEIYEIDDSWLLIANKAATNRTLKEQYEDTQYRLETATLAPVDGWRVQEKILERASMNYLMTLNPI